MLNKEQDTRITGEEILKHKWFKNIDINKMNKLDIKPPFVPNCDGNEWMKNFDVEFISEDAVHSNQVSSKNLLFDI